MLLFTHIERNSGLPYAGFLYCAIQNFICQYCILYVNIVFVKKVEVGLAGIDQAARQQKWTAGMRGGGVDCHGKHDSL